MIIRLGIERKNNITSTILNFHQEFSSLTIGKKVQCNSKTCKQVEKFDRQVYSVQMISIACSI